MHLRDADLFGDLGLGLLVKEPQDEDRAVAGRELGQYWTQRLAMVDQRQLGIQGADELAQRRGALPATEHLIQRRAAIRLPGLQPFDPLRDRYAQPVCKLAGPGGPPQLLGQLRQGASDGQVQVLEPAGYPGRPAVVAELPADFAGDRRYREGQEGRAPGGFETVHRIDQADGGDPTQVVPRLSAPGAAAGRGFRDR